MNVGLISRPNWLECLHPTATRQSRGLTALQVMSRRRDVVDCRDWRLVITGHSLGAGAAALVALYVHNFFPKCAHLPPCCTMTVSTRFP